MSLQERLIEIEGICAGYGKEKIIENISFEVGEKELVGILGANGSGKSTLVKAVCNLLPHEGDVRIGGQSLRGMTVKETAKRVSYVPQSSGISMDISVLDVVMMGFYPELKLLQNPGADRKERARAVIDSVGLSDKINRNYMQLSEGQKKLVILARTLVSEGKLLIMDEPESALDFNVKYKMMTVVRQWLKEGERGALVILHDANLALNCCDKLVLLKDRSVAGIIDLKKDSADVMEEKLGRIYEDISLVQVTDRSGKRNSVMICSPEGI